MANGKDSARSSYASELFKERFAFASGNILASGILVLNLWPVVAGYQTGVQLHFWTTNTPGEGVHPQLWIFWLATGLLATGICAVFFATIHILCRGLWLGSRPGSESGQDSSASFSVLHRVAERTYGASFISAAFLLFVAAVTPLVLLSAGAEQFLVHAFSLTLSAAGWISRSVLVMVFLLVCWKWFFPFVRDNGTYVLSDSGAFAGMSYLLAAALFFVVWLAVIELCHTVDLAVDRQIVSIRHDDTLRIDVVLGGSTSDPAKAQLTLRPRARGGSQPLKLTDFGEGRYVAVVPVAKLAAGTYDATVEYPHLALTSTFPHVQRTRKSASLIVLP